MKINRLFYVICFFVVSLVNAQNKHFTLEEIWQGAFRTQGIDALHSMQNGQQYSVLNFDRATRSTSVDLYDYKTQQKIKSLVSSTNLDAIQYFLDYTFSEDESKLLLATDLESIYRRSSVGKYYVYDVLNKTLTPVSDNSIQEPTFSPKGDKVAYVFENNIYVKDLANNTTTQLTTDGEKNKIINGVTDWVYEEEFSFVRAFEWSPNGNKIAYLKFDESEVPVFSMDIYGKTLYPQQEVFKYPKAGEKNSLVTMYIYDFKQNKSVKISPTKHYTDYYIPRFQWTNSPGVLSVQYMNRHQNELDLWFVNANTLNSRLVFSETDKAYIDVTDNLTFLKDNSFIWTSETDGYNHIYHYSSDGQLINQVTKGPWDVTNFYGYDPVKNKVYYQSVEENSIDRDVYSIGLNGKGKKRLSHKAGTNAASFSANFTYFINTFSSATTPPEYTLNLASNGKVVKLIKDNRPLLQQLAAYRLSEKEFSTINVNGNALNMWMIKPADFDETKQYPLFLYQYSGPGSQSVANQWNGYNDYWYQMLAQKGFVIACVDGRGTGFKGADFKKVTQKQLGKYEVEDQIQAAKQLGALPYIDQDRIGIWGWSYGGFMSSNALFKGSDVFKMAIAVAPVTNWRFYDSIYTERYMTTPQENPDGYDDNSPINFVDGLQGDFLLVHGSADDNVHVQNTMRMVEALVQADKQFEWAIYPDKNHGIYGGNTRIHLYKKMTDFIERTLGDKQENQTN